MEGDLNVEIQTLSTIVDTTGKNRFKILSWNIDGLDQHRETLAVRTFGVVDVIRREKPDVVFLQEVIPESLTIFIAHLLDYEYFIGNDGGYFVAIMTRRDTIKIQGKEMVPYPSSMMNRNLIIVHAIYEDKIEMDLMTTHQESCQRSANERICQLKICFEKTINVPQNRIVLFGGDLNMRDSELLQAGGIPMSFCDLWEQMGKNKDCAYTWDMQTNTNLNFARNGFLPRCRYDRLYFRPTISSAVNFKPISFKLQGLEMIPFINRFSSDHWAIEAEFEI